MEANMPYKDKQKENMEKVEKWLKEKKRTAGKFNLFLFYTVTD